MSDLFKAIDKVLQETEIGETPHTTALLKELRRTSGGTKRNWPDGLLIDGHPPKFFDFDAAVAQVAAHAVSENRRNIVTDDELSKLRDLQGRMDDIMAKAETCSLSKVNDHLNSFRDKIAENIADGGQIDDLRMPTRDALHLESLTKQRAYNAALVKITHQQLAPLATPILERFNTAVEELLKETESGDRFICESYALEYHPSLLWKGLALVAQRFVVGSRIPNPAAWITPSQLFRGIVQL